MKKSLQSSLVGPLCVLFGYLTFSTNGMWLLLSPEGATPYTVSAFRMTIGASVLFFLLKWQGKRICLKDWNLKYLLIYGVGTWAYQLTFYNAVLAVGIAVGTVVSVGTTPIFAAVLEWVIRKKTPQKMWYVATLLAIAGVVLLNRVESHFEWIDLSIPLLAGFFSGATLLAGPELTRGHDPQIGGTLSAILIAFLMLPFFIFFPTDWVLSLRGAICVLMLGIVNTAIGYLLVFRGFKTTQATVAASLTLAEPMGATLIGMIFLGEDSTLFSIAGIVCILVSVIVLVMAEAHSQKSLA